jgi:hypothetical protein
MKLCRRCNTEKTKEEFFGNVKRSDGVSTYCKPCQLEYQRQRYNNPENHKQHKLDRNIYLKNRKNSTRKWYLKTTYGLTPEEYDNLYAKYNGKCYICLQTKDYYLHVDHDHKTGKIRGLLCGNCNRAIGLFLDNYETVVRAANYLKDS